MGRAILLPIALCTALAFPLHAAISVSIDGRAVTASGVTPGAGAVFFSVGHEPHRAWFKIRRVARYVADEDRDGIVTCPFDWDVPARSVWFVADPATRAYVTATPGVFPQLSVSDRRSSTRKDTAGQWSALVHERQWLELLIINKGGVYELTAMRGGAADVEKKKGSHFATPVEIFRPVTPGARPLKHLDKGDVVIAIDPRHIESFVMEVE